MYARYGNPEARRVGNGEGSKECGGGGRDDREDDPLGRTARGRSGNNECGSRASLWEGGSAVGVEVERDGYIDLEGDIDEADWDESGDGLLDGEGKRRRREGRRCSLFEKEITGSEEGGEKAWAGHLTRGPINCAEWRGPGTRPICPSGTAFHIQYTVLHDYACSSRLP